ncbi:hypothetical protein GCM10009841_36400 [Microlunatus panaciterrae]
MSRQGQRSGDQTERQREDGKEEGDRAWSMQSQVLRHRGKPPITDVSTRPEPVNFGPLFHND